MARIRPTSICFAVLAFAAACGCQTHQNPQTQAKQLFDTVCGKCHGSDGRGGVPTAEGQPEPRNFCDAAFQASRSDEDLKRVIKNGKGPMPPFSALLDDAQVDQLVAHIRSFDPARGSAHAR